MCVDEIDAELVKILEEQHPAGLFDVVQFAAAPSVFSKGIVDIFESGLGHVVFRFLLHARLLISPIMTHYSETAQKRCSE